MSKSVERRMAAQKVIRITCRGAGMMPLSEIKELQGQLKSLSKENYEKLKALILDLGFSFPIEVAVVDGKPLGVVDGHQRLRTVRNMIEKEGFRLEGGKLPVCWKYCKDRKEAGKAILAAISQFGKTEEDGLYEFMDSFKIDSKSLKTEFDVPDFDTEGFLDGYFEEDGGQKDAEPQIDRAAELNKKWKVKPGDLFGIGKFTRCPKCGKIHNLDGQK